MPTFRLISTPRWIWLATLVLSVASGILYGIFGDVTRTVSAFGVTRQGVDLLLVTASRAGEIQSVVVKRGDLVAEGDPVAILDTVEIDAELARIRERIAFLTTESTGLEAVEDATLHEAALSRDATLREAEEIVNATKDLLDRRKQFLASQEALLEEGLLAGETILRSRAEVAELQNAIDAAETSAAEARLDVARLTAAVAVDRAARRQVIATANAERQRLEQRRASEFTIRSDVGGRVDGVGVDVGTFVQPGDRILRLRPQTEVPDELRILAFVPQGRGKLADPGDRVQILPRFVDVSRYGYLEGRLTEIAEMGALPEELSLLLADPLLVTELLQREQAVLVAEIAIDRDPSTTSGYKWSSREGWPGQIGPGAIVDLNIVYEVDRPIELFLPWIRSLFGE